MRHSEDFVDHQIKTMNKIPCEKFKTFLWYHNAVNEELDYLLRCSRYISEKDIFKFEDEVLKPLREYLSYIYTKSVIKDSGDRMLNEDLMKRLKEKLNKETKKEEKEG